MTTKNMDAVALLLDQNYFELDAKGYATFQEMVDNPPPTTARLRRTLISLAPWEATAAATGKSAPAVYSGKVAPERGRRREEIKAISGSHALLTNIVLAWNTFRMHVVVEAQARRDPSRGRLAAPHRPSALLAHQLPRHDEIRRREVRRGADPARAWPDSSDGFVTRPAQHPLN